MLTARTLMGRDLPTLSLSTFILTTMAFPATKSTQLSHGGRRTGSTFTLHVCDNPPCQPVLYPGRYWVEIQANMTAMCCGEWGWTDRTVTDLNCAVWRNPSGFFGACISWSRRAATCGLDPSAPDRVYQIYANLISTPTATATPTASATPTATASATPTPTPRPSPTPRPAPSARSRPTPAGRP